MLWPLSMALVLTQEVDEIDALLANVRVQLLAQDATHPVLYLQGVAKKLDEKRGYLTGTQKSWVGCGMFDLFSLSVVSQH